MSPHPDERAIFNIARRLDSPEARSDYLEQICGGDKVLKDRVVALLNGYEKSVALLETPVSGLAGTIVIPGRKDLAGTCIGPYKLRELLGEGGMGVVYLAEQTDPIQRKVALKIVKPGISDRNVLARFEAERQALAMMDHPNIARIVDGGLTDTDQPYFVMELVQGLPITEFCDRQRMSVRQRLQVFLHVCQAVHHAHQKGIIHRDLKPSNVLVGTIDNEPVPKVIDFGVAKAVGSNLSDATVYTQFSQLIGTPLYMSPEQFELGVIDIDVRSDVYSLGVMLYELLTGETPVSRERLKTATFEQMRKIVVEQEATRPSALLDTMDANKRTTIAERHSISSRDLIGILRGEIDWLVMKALEKDRKRRYESASAMAADIRRYLENEPLEAGPPTVTYRLRKFASRHRVVLASSSLVAIALLFGFAAAGWQAWRATTERNEKQIALEDREQALITANQNLQIAMDAVDRVYLSKALNRVDNLGRSTRLFAADDALDKTWEASLLRSETTDEEKALFQEGVQIYSKIAKQNPSNPDAKHRAAVAYMKIGLLQACLGDTKAASTSYATAIGLLADLNDGNLDARSLTTLAEAHYLSGQLAELWTDASQSFSEAVSIANLCIQSAPRHSDAYKIRARSQIGLSRMNEAIGDLKLVALLEPEIAVNHSTVARVIQKMGGDKNEALGYAKRAVELDPSAREFRSTLTSLLDDPEEIAAVWEDYLIYVSDQNAAQHVQLLIATIRGQWGKVLEISTTLIESEGFYDAYIKRSNVYRVEGKIDLALADLDAASEVATQSWQLVNIGNAYWDLGKREKAIMALRRAESVNPDNYWVHMNLAKTLDALGRSQEGLVHWQKAFELEPFNLECRKYLVKALLAQGDYDQVLSLIQLAIEQDPIQAQPTTFLTLDEVGHSKDEDFKTRFAELQQAVRERLESTGVDLSQQAGLCKARADSHFYAGQFELAVEEITRAIELDDQQAEYYYIRGNAQSELARFSEALLDFDKAITLNPTNPFYHNNRAFVFAAMGEYQKSIECFEKAKALNPGDAGYAINLGCELAARENWGRAIAEFESALIVSKHREYNRAAMLNLAWLYASCPNVQSRDLARSLELAEQLIGFKLPTGDGQIYQALAAAKFRNGQYEEALEAFLQADSEYKQASNNPQPSDFTTDFEAPDFIRAMTLWKLDKREEAVACFRKAVERCEEVVDNANKAKEIKVRLGATTISLREEARQLLQIDSTSEARSELEDASKR